MLTIIISKIPKPFSCCVLIFCSHNYFHLPLKGVSICISDKEVILEIDKSGETLIEDQRTHSPTTERKFSFPGRLKRPGESRAQCFHSWPPYMSVNRFQWYVPPQGKCLFARGFQTKWLETCMSHLLTRHQVSTAKLASPLGSKWWVYSQPLCMFCFLRKTFLRAETGWVFFAW